MLPGRRLRWRRDPSQTASGKAGAVHSATERLWGRSFGSRDSSPTISSRTFAFNPRRIGGRLHTGGQERRRIRTMLDQALEWVAQHRAAMVALVIVLALTLLAGRRR